MALLTIPSVTKGESATITLNKTDLFNLGAVSGDAYFSVQANVKSAIVEFNSDPSNQVQRLKFDLSEVTPSAVFLASATARDDFLLESILLIDNDGGTLMVRRADLPSGLDISLAGGGGSLPVSSGLYSWFKAGSLSLSDGASVTSWSDESGSVGSANMVQNGANPAPIYVASSINSLPAIRNDQVGNGSEANSKHLVMNRAFPSTDCTVFIVAKGAVGAANQGTLFSEQNVFGDGSTALSVHHRANQGGKPLYGYYSSPFAQPNIGAVGEVAFVLATEVDGGSFIKQYLNGTLAATSNGDAFGGGFRKSKVWLFNFYQWNFLGDIAEFIIYDRLLTTQERADVTSYLGTKYAISVA